MAVPSDPTALSIVTEALKRAGIDVPSPIQTARAQNEWMEEIKTEIYFSSTRHKLLETSSVFITTAGLSRYALPADFNYPIGLDWMDGDSKDRGTAQTGTVNTLTLEASDTSSSDRRIGREIVLTGGAGSGQIGTVINWDESTKVATTTDNWTVIPDSTTTYLVVQRYKSIALSGRSSFDFSELQDRTVQGNPITGSSVSTTALNIVSVTDGQFFIYDNLLNIWPVPDKSTYGMRLTYGVNLTRLDLTSTLLTKLYREWKAIWVQGVKVKAFEAIDDERLGGQLQIYSLLLEQLSKKTMMIDNRGYYRDL